MNINVNTKIDFGTNNSNAKSSSSITGTNNNSSTYGATYTSNNNIQTESMDLSFATEEIATESKSILESIGDFFNGVGEGIKNTGATIASKTKTVANWAINGLKELGSNIKEACGNLASNVKSILGNTLTWAADTFMSIQSTAAVIGTSIVSGIADIGEGLVDGLAWTGGKLVEGGSWLVGKVAGLFSDEAEKSVMEWRSNTKENVKDFIANDWVGKANDWFYQETEIGKYINENSYLKYDSESMQKLRKVSEVVGKIVVATAATVATGGAAAPLALGFLFGTGTQSEKVYQGNQNATGTQELGILVSGLGEAANWYAQGKLGQGALSFIDALKVNGIKNTGTILLQSFKSNIGNIKTNGVKETIKGITKNTNLSSLAASDNLADSAGIVADNASDWLVGNEEFNLGNVLKASGELVAAWGLNMFFDGASEYIGKMDNTGLEKTNISTTSIESTQNPQSSVKQVKTIEQERLELNQQVTNEINGLNKYDSRYHINLEQIQDRATYEAQLLQIIHNKGVTLEEYIASCNEIPKFDDYTTEIISQEAQNILDKAKLVEPDITSSIQSLEDSKSHLVGLDYRFKSQTSIKSKISRTMAKYEYTPEIAALQVNDSLRYTLICDADTYSTTVIEKLAKLKQEGYTVKWVNNAWDNSTYKGLNFTLTSPSNVDIELQFHTPASFNVKQNQNHLWYEISRSQKVDYDVKNLSDKIQALNQKTYNTDNISFNYYSPEDINQAIGSYNQL